MNDGRVPNMEKRESLPVHSERRDAWEQYIRALDSTNEPDGGTR